MPELRCEWNMPDGATTEQADRHFGYDRPDDDEPEDDLCGRCNDYPCRCLRDEQGADTEPPEDADVEF
jgi:hypothetical protein